jgi:V/A-type H+-transporting ATPase subunit I
MSAIERERAELKARIEMLAPWTSLHVQLCGLAETPHVTLLTGTVPRTKAVAIREALRETVAEVSVEELPGDAPREAWVVMVCRGSVDEVRNLLALSDFEESSFGELTDYPAEESSRAQENMRRLAAEGDVLVARATALAEYYPKAFALADALSSRRRAVSVRHDFGSTERTFVACGWVRESKLDAVRDAVSAYEDVDLTFDPPAEDDDPPVALDNPRWLQPFEVLTDLYGRPCYGELDPTPLLAVPFFVFFGLCVGDFGYGLSLLALAWLIKHRLDVAPGVKRFMDLLMYCSVSVMVVGVLTGSYFAIPTEELPEFLQSLAILDPLEEILTLLVFAVLLGVLHVFLGVGVKAYDLVRKGQVATAFYDELSTFLMWAVIIGVVVAAVWAPDAVMPLLVLGFVLTVLLKGRVFERPLTPEGVPAWDRALGWAWLLASLAWLVALAFGGPSWFGWAALAATLTAGVSRAVRACIVGVLAGLYKTFDTLTGFTADFLSYTRLAALGLASLVVGWVVNVLVGLMSFGGGLVVVGSVLGALIFIVGHSFNIVISLLGAIVHPLRLQYMEFFGKFYEGGGAEYRPFGFDTTALVLRREAPEEGGTSS